MTVDDVRVVLQIEWDVVVPSRHEDDRLTECMSITGLVEHVGIPSGHVSDEQIGLGNLVVETRKNVVGKICSSMRSQ